MSKKWIVAEVGCIDFEVNMVDYLTSYEVGKRRKTRGLYDCYSRPSDTKIEIWEQWKRWFFDMDSYDVWVESYNTNFFTIAGTIEWKGGKYFIYITPAHNRMWKYEN